MDALAREIERVKAIVGRQFPIYETKVRGDILSVYVKADEATLGQRFDALRKELMPQGFIPMILKEKGEHIILVQRKPSMRFRGPRANLILLVLTGFTTVLAGGSLWAGYQGKVPDPADPLSDFRLALAPDNAGLGALFFALPLLGILGIHEMGHYLTAKRHGVAASLPFFLPSLPPLGTFGALISMREPIPNKKALIDIGISGPLAGLAVAIPVSAAGLYFTRILPGAPIVNEGGNLTIGLPALWDLFLLPLIPLEQNVSLHPLAFAGWVGLFVTALNLLPAGQLDGGHIARALLGRHSRWLSMGTIVAMLVLGLLYYLGWMILAIFILVLGPRHPPPLDDLTRLTIDRHLLGVSAVVVMAVCFVLIPLQPVAAQTGMEFSIAGGPVSELNLTLQPAVAGVVNFTLKNTGNVREEVTLSLGPNATALVNQSWTVKFVALNGTAQDSTNLTFSLDQDNWVNVTLRIVPSNTQGNQPYRVDVVAQGNPEVREVFMVLVRFP